MPKVTAPADCRLVALDHQLVEAGETVEVDEDTARSLIEQGWADASDEKPAPKRARTQPAAEPGKED